MDVGAQKNLEGQQTFDRKMTLNFVRKATAFSVDFWWPPKKRSSMNLRRFFGRNYGDLQAKKQKKQGFQWNWDGFSDRIKVTSKKKGLHWNWDGCVNFKLPKILTQTCRNNMKLLEISHFETKRRASASPDPRLLRHCFGLCSAKRFSSFWPTKTLPENKIFSVFYFASFFFFVKIKIWYECLQNQVLNFFAVTRTISIELNQNRKRAIKFNDYVLRSLYSMF